MSQVVLPGVKKPTDVQKPRSCLIAKLGYYIALSEIERALILRLEETERSCKHGNVVWQQGEEATSMFVVKSGWMYAYSVLPDGRRQVLDIYCPGDILGLRDIAFDYSLNAVAAACDAVLCPFPKSAMDDVFSESPRLATLLYSLGMLENIVVIDRLKTTARQDARERLCYFFLQLFSRLKITNPQLTTKFRLPLTQELIGDALGLSQVHVNRTIRQIEKEGIIKRDGQDIEFLDIDQMRRICTFEDRHYRIDTSWFPQK